MPTFDLVVVGAGGGPSETNLSAYLLKPHTAPWRDGIVALEAGSGIGKLTDIMKDKPALFLCHDDGCDDPDECPRLTPREIYSLIQCFLITHAHLDHVLSLVLSAGSLQGPRRRIHGSKRTIKNLESAFNSKIWPNLASWDPNDDAYKLLYDPLTHDKSYRNIFRDVSVRMMPLNHGQAQSGPYESSAFFLRHDPTGQEFLFFGDVEPDSISAAPQSIAVWRAAAPSVPDKLSAVFIECSWPSGRDDDSLFGHLTPEHLVDELAALAAEVVLAHARGGTTAKRVNQNILDKHIRKKRRPNSVAPDALVGALKGLRVYIIHCKDATAEFEKQHGKRAVHLVIADQVRELVETRGLGAEILSAEQGTRITF